MQAVHRQEQAPALHKKEWKIMSFDRLIDKIIETGNPTGVGLDP